MKNHLIVCGTGHVGYQIARMLHRLGEPFAVITTRLRPDWREEMEAMTSLLIEGDARAEACLRAAHVADAHAILVVTDDDLINMEIALDAQRLNPRAAVVTRVFDADLASRVERISAVRRALSPALLTAPAFVAAALGQNRMRVFNVDGEYIHILRLVVREGLPGVGQEPVQFCAKRGLFLLSRFRSSMDASTAQHLLRAGDTLTVTACGTQIAALAEEGMLPTSVMSRHLPFETLRHSLRGLAGPFGHLRRTWRHSGSALKVAFFLLLMIVVTSGSVFRRHLPGVESWVDALYFTVTIATTIGFGDYNFREAPDWLKLYGSFVMISGAALVAITYGLITDMVVTARVQQALGRTPTRLHDHVIVVGLGDVGTRVTEELLRLGQGVVAIEREEQREASPTIEDHVHVIVSDANRRSTLEMANAPGARAIIVTTTNDLDSLRIAHQAKAAHSDLRAVVRLYDSSLARKVGDTLDIDATVNGALMAAPTFVACALCEGVEQAFELDGRLWLLRWLPGAQMDTLTGRTASDLQQEGIQPLLRRTQSGLTHAFTEDDTISPGDALLTLEEYRANKTEPRTPG